MTTKGKAVAALIVGSVVLIFISKAPIFQEFTALFWLISLASQMFAMVIVCRERQQEHGAKEYPQSRPEQTPPKLPGSDARRPDNL